MKSRIVLVTGGARSGKSRYAEERAGKAGRRLLYVATAEARDEEMARRIADHRARRGGAWLTVEEPVEITRRLLEQRGKVDAALVDCLTLWVSNLLLRGDEKAARTAVEELAENTREINFPLFLVTNEVGWGIVPDNPLARAFRDLTGWTSQRLAAAADEVVLMVAGVPMIVKGRACD
ncbi:MAG TPA: bifunctional adenosylcobinamide kinase/adenosylcobinamide-phosphate guanylyltransferase [Candidatus Binatia bacterium]